MPPPQQSENHVSNDVLYLHAEELRAQREAVVTEEVIIQVRVVTEKRMIEVDVRREELVVERRPIVSGAAAQVGDNTVVAGKTVTILLHEEDIRIQKVPVVIEEIHVTKRRVEEMRTFTETVRREEAVVDTIGDMDVVMPNETATPSGR